jgi:hypothetical protein
MTVDTAQETLYSLCLDQWGERTTAAWLAAGNEDPLPTAWNSQLLDTSQWAVVAAAEADPWDLHGVYVAGYGAVGYLRPSGNGVQVDLWSSVSTSDPLTALPGLLAIWPDPEQRGRLFFGGATAGAAALFERAGAGTPPSAVPFEDNPSGSVVGIGLSPDESQIVITVALEDRSLAVYLLTR